MAYFKEGQKWLKNYLDTFSKVRFKASINMVSEFASFVFKILINENGKSISKSKNLHGSKIH